LIRVQSPKKEEVGLIYIAISKGWKFDISSILFFAKEHLQLTLPGGRQMKRGRAHRS